LGNLKESLQSLAVLGFKVGRFMIVSSYLRCMDLNFDSTY